jgi:hypothetical protein
MHFKFSFCMHTSELLWHFRHNVRTWRNFTHSAQRTCINLCIMILTVNLWQTMYSSTTHIFETVYLLLACFNFYQHLLLTIFILLQAHTMRYVTAIKTHNQIIRIDFFDACVITSCSEKNQLLTHCACYEVRLAYLKPVMLKVYISNCD